MIATAVSKVVTCMLVTRTPPMLKVCAGMIPGTSTGSGPKRRCAPFCKTIDTPAVAMKGIRR